MDIQMPIMDGYTSVRKMREIDDRRNVPIYAVTAHAGLADAQKCIDAGFTDRIVKPLVRGDIYASLAKAFALVPGKLDFQEDDNAIPRRMLDKLMPTFLKARADDLTKLDEALKRFDYETIARLGHKMKGSSASYGIEEARTLSHELEAAAKSRNAAECMRLSEKLQSVFSSLSK
jgi:HPt (histidine-containing phosphotransfer) domain-containing protein